MWNIKSDNFVHSPSFLGHDINADKIVAYAACGNGVTTGDFARLLPCEDFSAFTSLSARDYDTVKCVEQVSKRTVMRVVDPTMLIDDFDIDIPQCPISNDFILVYSYGIDKKHIKGIKTFAKKNKLPLISVGTYNSWCDKNVVANPWEFLGYLRAAKYVIVSTFHGTVLSVKFNKQFVCFAGNSSKVRDILSFYDLMDRNVQGLENVDTLFKSTIDYTTANEIIKQSRNLSMNYLREALGL